MPSATPANGAAKNNPTSATSRSEPAIATMTSDPKMSVATKLGIPSAQLQSVQERQAIPDGAEGPVADEMARLNAVLARDEFYCPQAVAVIRLLMLTGCRFGEAVSLEWDWIRGKGIHLPDSKSGPRTVWLSNAARAAIDAIPRYSPEAYSDEFFALGDDAIESRVIDEIRKYTPSMPVKPAFTRIYRWDHAVCLPHGGMMRDLQALRDGDFPGVGGLFLAGEYLHPFASVNGALASGVDAAGEAVRFLER